MSAAGSVTDRSATALSEPERHPWWTDREVLIPVASGVALLVAWALDLADVATAARVLYWVALFLGAVMFVPGAMRKLFVKRKLGVALLMTIGAAGAVFLGYIEEAAALAFLYAFAEALEHRAMDRAQFGLRALLKVVPDTATISRDGATITIDAKDLRVGQTLVVRPGERVATDGIIRVGRSSLDTSAITGESIPIEVGPGETVAAGSINTSGLLEVEATAAGADNSLTTIVHLVEQAQAQKGARARLADKIARPLVPGVLVLAALVGVVGSLLGDPEFWITRALVVLVAASPCALAVAVPITVVSAIGAASKFGVIVKSGAAFERFGKIGHVAVDKTGTLTRNQPAVARVATAGDASREEVLAWAASLEQHSTHPLADAILAASPAPRKAQKVVERAGHGITGRLDGIATAVGSPRWLDPGSLSQDVEAMERDGITAVIVQRADSTVGAIGIRDELRREVPDVVSELRRRGIGVSMLTGDNERTAQSIATEAGISDVRAEMRPEDKAAAVTELSRSNPTAMIGDGINDSPALAAADLGIAMGVGGSDAAIESADIAFTGHDLRLIPHALTHAQSGHRIITQNLVLSILIIACLIPLAITGVLGLAAVVLVHEVAEVLVILNGLRASRTRRPTLKELSDK